MTAAEIRDVVVDLFAGPGGWDEGLRAAGYTGRLVGIDHDPDACATAVAAGHERICADVLRYPPGSFDRVDAVIGSPPCPTFSQAGQGAGRLLIAVLATAMTRIGRGRPAIRWAHSHATRVLKAHAATDRKLRRLPRAARSAWAVRHARMSVLTVQPIRWVAAVRPRWVALEQVPAVLVLWRHAAVVLRELGYRVWTGVLSAEQYETPQTRNRAVLVARRDGIPAAPPAPSRQPYQAGRAAQTQPDLFGNPLPPPVSMAEALGWGVHRPAWTVTAGGTATGGAEIFSNAGNRAELAATLALRNTPQSNASVRDLHQPAGTVYCSRAGNLRWALRNGNQAHACVRGAGEPAGTLFFGARTNAVDWVEAPAQRRACRTDPGRGAESVRVSVAEAAVLQGFRPDYPWHGTTSAQYRQVGDAVPPPLAAAILRPLLTAKTGD